jgi:hypothetical protein
MNEHKLRTNLNHLKTDLKLLTADFGKLVKISIKTVLLYTLYLITAFWIGNMLSSFYWRITTLNNMKVSMPVDFSIVTNEEDKTKSDIIAHMDDGTEKVVTVPTSDLNDPEVIIQKTNGVFYDGRTVPPETK